MQSTGWSYAPIRQKRVPRRRSIGRWRRLSKMSMGPQTSGETGHKENHLGIGPDSFP